jgi:hypothetical protein
MAPGEKICRVTLKYSGQVKTWVCKKEEPCVWHEINVVKCGCADMAACLSCSIPRRGSSHVDG